jgi:hypothetical protein
MLHHHLPSPGLAGVGVGEALAAPEVEAAQAAAAAVMAAAVTSAAADQEPGHDWTPAAQHSYCLVSSLLAAAVQVQVGPAQMRVLAG